MVALLAFGGTYAYFTATTASKETNAVTTGIVNLGADTAATLSITKTKLLPKDTVTLEASVSNGSDVDTIVYVQIKLDKSSITADSASLTLPAPTGWTLVEGQDDIYSKELTAGAKAELSAEAVFDCDANSADGVQDTTAMGQDIKVTVAFGSIQKDFVTDAKTGLTELAKVSGCTITPKAA